MRLHCQVLVNELDTQHMLLNRRQGRKFLSFLGGKDKSPQSKVVVDGAWWRRLLSNDMAITD